MLSCFLFLFLLRSAVFFLAEPSGDLRGELGGFVLRRIIRSTGVVVSRLLIPFCCKMEHTSNNYEEVSSGEIVQQGTAGEKVVI